MSENRLVELLMVLPTRPETKHVRAPAASGRSQANQPRKRTSEATTVQDGAKLRILVAEDDRDTAEGLTRLLRHMGFEAQACFAGLQCLTTLKDFQPQIVLLDIGMPEIDGYEIAKRIRESLPSNPPVLMALTGYGRPADRERTAQAGFACHLLKPVLASDLKAAIEQARRQLQR